MSETTLSRHGIPDCVVTDNDPQFSSGLFYDFSQQWMFQHIRTSPHYPQVNGMAESAVKTAKTLIKTAIASKAEPWLAILAHRNTPSQGMTTSPAQRMFCRQTKGLLPLAESYTTHNPTILQDDTVHFQQRQEREKTDSIKMPVIFQACHPEADFLLNHTCSETNHGSQGLFRRKGKSHGPMK